jgi:hypothetical protein
MRPTRRLAAALLALATVAGCGRGAAAAADAAASADSAAPAASPATDGAPAASGAAVTAADAQPGPSTVRPEEVEKLRTGMQAEVAFHDSALARIKQAKTGNDSMAVLTELISGKSDEKGAAAAGLPLERYKTLRIVVTQALGARQMGQSPMMRDMAKTDTSEMSAEQRAQFRENMRQMQAAWGDPFKDFPAETRAKLESEGAHIDTLQARLIQAQMTAAGR